MQVSITNVILYANHVANTFTVFSDYKNSNGTTYDGFNVYATLEIAEKAATTQCLTNSVIFKSVVNGFYLLSVDKNGKIKESFVNV